MDGQLYGIVAIGLSTAALATSLNVQGKQGIPGSTGSQGLSGKQAHIST